jgi:hypothetical protein
VIPLHVEMGEKGFYFTEETVEVFPSAVGGMETKLIKVPSIPNAIAYVCFKIAGRRPLQCLYIFKDGAVEQRMVVTKEEEI